MSSFQSSSLSSLLLVFGVGCIEYTPKEIQPIEDQYATIVVDPEYIDFGARELGTTTQETLQVGNTGNIPLEIDSILLSQGAFSYTMPEPIQEIAPGEWAELIVEYRPVNIADGKMLSIASNDQNAPVVDVPLLGQQWCVCM